MPTKAKRILDLSAKIEMRKTDDGKRFVDGMIPYNSRSEEMWGFVEEIAPTAFNKTLSDGAEVFAFWAHNDGEILGSRSAKTLLLDNRTDGLHFSIEMRDSAISEDRWMAIERGDVAGVSFGFFAEREEWNNASEPHVRTLKEVRLLEISVGVAFPAYSGAQSAAAVRSLCAEAGVDVGAALAPKPEPQPSEARDTIPPEQPPAPPTMALGELARAELDIIAAACGIGA